MKFPDDKIKIGDWERKYGDSKNFEGIKRYILENDTYLGLEEVIETNHEIFHIGDDEKKLAFVAENKDGEILAWVLLTAFDLKTAEPQMFLQYIVVNPKYQHKGIGTKVANEFFCNTQEYVGVKPTEIFSYIEKTNKPSISLFSKFNFNFSPMQNSNYLKAVSKEPMNLEKHSALNQK